MRSTEDLRANKLYTGKLQALLRSSSGGTIKLEEIHLYFSEMYSEHYDDDSYEENAVDNIKLPIILINEVHKAIDNLKSSKLPAGPSGFTALFFKKFKGTLSPLLMDEFNKFIKNGHAPS